MDDVARVEAVALDRSGRSLGRLLARGSIAVLIGLAVANCAGSREGARRRGTVNKYGVVASPRVIPDGQPIPKGGGREMIGKPYVVGGRTYQPHDGRGYAREGWASWYGTAFHGRLTANGEVFDRQSVAAAHPTLPLPSYVRVTNVVNKRSMVVRVNDRGPYERDRLIDVSERVAVALEFHRKGTSRVRVEYLGRASTRGSDDDKLLATLRTDGEPAPFGRARGPVMMADLRDEPKLRPSTLPPIEDDAPVVALAAATPSAQAEPDDDAVVAKKQPAREQMRPAAAVQPVASVAAVLPTPPYRPDARVRWTAPAAHPAPGTPVRSEPLPPHRPHLAGIY